MAKSPLKIAALKFIILIGVVDLFSDLTYEGARSISGPFLAILGASGAAVGIIVGFGELVGYGVRVFSGYFSDRTGSYWAVALIGYVINLAAVPLLALAGTWQMAALFIILERFGKAIRAPARDAMLSYASKQTGRGWGFGLHEALDQIGAVLGPLLITGVLLFRESYRLGFALLAIPAGLALIVLATTRFFYAKPHEMEVYKGPVDTKGLRECSHIPNGRFFALFSSFFAAILGLIIQLCPSNCRKKWQKNQQKIARFGICEHTLTKTYWIYLIAVGLVAAGYVDFALIAYHFKKISSFSSTWIPFFYAVAMGVDGIAALIVGRLFDFKGIIVLAIVTGIASLFAPFVFWGNFYGILFGMVLWGIGMGSQESIMRAFVAELVPPHKRGSAYGVLNLGFGVAWAIGSAVMGLLYDISLVYLIAFSIFTQLASIPFFLIVRVRSQTLKRHR